MGKVLYLLFEHEVTLTKTEDDVFDEFINFLCRDKQELAFVVISVDDILQVSLNSDILVRFIEKVESSTLFYSGNDIC